MSPEVCTDKLADSRADVYSLAAILYQAVGGVPPFESPSPMEVVSMHLAKAPPPISSRCPGLNVSRHLETVIMKALSKKPEERYGSMREFSAALKRSLVGKEVSPLRGQKGRRRRTPVSKPMLLLIGAGLAIAFGALVIFFARALAQLSWSQIPPPLIKSVAPAVEGSTKSAPSVAPQAIDKANVSSIYNRKSDYDVDIDAFAQPRDAGPMTPSRYKDP
jgi:serine/threonine protein kinase